MANWYLIFGAAVRADGSPSGTLRRRVDGAVALAKDDPTAHFLATGGVGRYTPAEAEVMKQLLIEAGVESDRIVTDAESSDTFSSVLACATFLGQRDDIHHVIVCTSRYHIPRCVWLLKWIGVPAVGGRMPSDRAALELWKWLWYHVREVPAFLWDTILIISRKAVTPD